MIISPVLITPTDQGRAGLESFGRARRAPLRSAQGARTVLAATDGQFIAWIAHQQRVHVDIVRTWRGRCAGTGLDETCRVECRVGSRKRRRRPDRHPQLEQRGARYAWGYPACPDVEDQTKVADLLDWGPIGVELSKAHQLTPEQSTKVARRPTARADPQGRDRPHPTPDTRGEPPPAALAAEEGARPCCGASPPHGSVGSAEEWLCYQR